MEEVTNVIVNYEPSDNIEKQGKYEKIKKYEKLGYYIKEERNGYWVLVKAAKVLVTLTNSKCTHTFNMKSDILNYYGKQKISKNLVDTFRDDVGNGKIKFEMDEEGTIYTIK